MPGGPSPPLKGRRLKRGRLRSSLSCNMATKPLGSPQQNQALPFQTLEPLSADMMSPLFSVCLIMCMINSPGLLLRENVGVTIMSIEVDGEMVEYSTYSRLANNNSRSGNTNIRPGFISIHSCNRPSVYRVFIFMTLVLLFQGACTTPSYTISCTARDVSGATFKRM
jgi:hypothetical protein